MRSPLLRLLRSHLPRYRGQIALIVALQVAQTVALLYLPTLNADIIDNGVVVGDMDYILRRGGLMLAITVVQVACLVAAVRFAAYTAMAVGRDIRLAVFDRVQSFSAREIGHFGTPSLVTRTTNDVQQVQTLVSAIFTMFVFAPIMGVGGVILALSQDVPLASILLLLILVLGLLMLLIIRRQRPLFRVMQRRIDAVNRVLREQITGIRVIRAFTKEKFEERRFGKANEELTDVSLRANRLTALIVPVGGTVTNLFTVPIVWLGAYRIAGADMEIGALTAFLGYVTLVLAAVVTASFMLMMLPRAEVCAERIIEVLDTESTLHPPLAPVIRIPRPGQLELRGVGFTYPGAQEAVLRGVDLTARPGQTTAIVGSTGSGKSTLLGLAARLADPTAGQVLVGGEDVRNLAPAALAKAVGLVPQAPRLFTGTVESNLRFGDPDATDEDLWRALEIAQARDFVEALGGLEAPVAQGGGNLSGGQQQRLTIARALVRRPQIYLFDDSFSALDYATDARLRAALADEISGACVVLVAQRVATIRHADQIVVLEAGAVVGAGTHDELIASTPVYREIVFSQLTEEEAAA